MGRAITRQDRRMNSHDPCEWTSSFDQRPRCASQMKGEMWRRESSSGMVIYTDKDSDVLEIAPLGLRNFDHYGANGEGLVASAQ